MKQLLITIYSKLPSFIKVLLIPAVMLYMTAGVLFKYKIILAFMLKKRKFMSTFNFIRAKLTVREEGGILLDPLIRAFPKLTPYPWCLEVEVTTKCDKKCITCEHTYWDEPKKDLSYDDFVKIVDQFPHLAWFNPTGEGEAFLNKDFLKMLKYLKSKNLFVFFNDTFDKVDEDVAKELIETGVDRIEVSMLGATRETYESIMVGHHFDKVMNNLGTLIQLKKTLKSPVPELCFHYIVNTLNVHELPQFIELVHSLGGKNSLGSGSYVNFSGLLEFEQIKDMVVEVPMDMIQTVNKLAGELNIGVLWTHLSHRESLKSPVSECVAWSEPYVLMGGDVISCCGVLMSNKRSFLRKYSFGNLLQQPFKEIWASERYRKFRQMIPKTEGQVPILCQGCRAYDTMFREKQSGVSKEI